MAESGHASIMLGLRRVLLVAGVSGLAGVLVAGLALPIAAGIGLVARESANGFSEMPDELDTSSPLPERSRILDSDGNLVATFYDDNRIYRTLDEIAPVFEDAVLAIEDHRFFERGPIDFQSTARAFVTNLEEGEIEEGGSTLTQQYAKKLAEAQATTEEEELAATEVTYGRKLRELRLAVGLEQELTKEEILEGYLNLVYFGAGAHGVEAAARRYFSTSAADLTLVQAATLAGIIQRPTAYDPTRNPEATQARRDVVLRRMAETDFITDQELEEALDQPLELDERERPNGCVGSSSAPFFCDYVYREIVGTQESGGMEALGRDTGGARAGAAAGRAHDPDDARPGGAARGQRRHRGPGGAHGQCGRRAGLGRAWDRRDQGLEPLARLRQRRGRDLSQLRGRRGHGRQRRRSARVRRQGVGACRCDRAGHRAQHDDQLAVPGQPPRG